MADSITVVDFKSTMDKLFADFSFIKDEMATMKGDQSHLTLATNQLQTEKIELSGSDGGTNKVKISTQPPPPPPNPPTAVFSMLDGAADPVVWLHKAERFFHTHGSPPSTWRVLPRTGTMPATESRPPPGQSPLTGCNTVLAPGAQQLPRRPYEVALTRGSSFPCWPAARISWSAARISPLASATPCIPMWNSRT